MMKVEPTITCLKHNQELCFYCKNCSRLICADCVEEHTLQGHVVTYLIKYIQTTVIPQLDQRIEDASALVGKDFETLTTHLLESKEKFKGYLTLINDSLDALFQHRTLTDPKKQARELKANLEEAIKTKNLKSAAYALATLENIENNYGMGDAEKHQLMDLLKLCDIFDATIASVGNFCGELDLFTKKLREPTFQFVHSFSSEEWTNLILYNPATREYKINTMKVPKSTADHVSTARIRDKLYFSGGCDEGEFLATAYELTVWRDLSIVQKQIADMNIEKDSHALVAYREAQIVSIGGLNTEGVLVSCEIYKVSDNTWKATSNLSRSRENPYACVVGNKWVYCFGGDGAKANVWIERLNMEAEHLLWQVISVVLPPPFNNRSHGGSAIQINDDTILIFGGWRSDCPSALFNFNTNQFSGVTRLAISDTCFSHTIPTIYGRKVFALATDNANLHIYSIEKNEWSAVMAKDWTIKK